MREGLAVTGAHSVCFFFLLIEFFLGNRRTLLKQTKSGYNHPL